MNIQLDHSEPGMTVLYDSAKTNAWLFFSLFSSRACLVTFQPAWYSNTSSHIHGWKSDSILGCIFPKNSVLDINTILERINVWLFDHSINPIVIIEDFHDWIFMFSNTNNDFLHQIVTLLRKLYYLVVNQHKGRILIRLHQDIMSKEYHNDPITRKSYQFISSWLYNNSHELLRLDPLASGLSRSIDGECTVESGGLSKSFKSLTWQYRWTHNHFGIKYWQKGSGQIFTISK